MNTLFKKLSITLLNLYLPTRSDQLFSHYIFHGFPFIEISGTLTYIKFSHEIEYDYDKETSYICKGVDWWSWIWESQWLLGSGVISSLCCLHCFESYSCMTCTVWTKKTFEFTSHWVCSMRFLVIMSLQFDFLLVIAWQPIIYIYIYSVSDLTKAWYM